MSKVSGVLLVILGILLAIYSILQFLVAPAVNGLENSRRNTTHVYGIPVPPIGRAISIIGLILVLIASAVLFLIGKLYYTTE